MTPQERDLLTRFLDDLARAQPGPRDAEAAGQIDRTLSANPGAAYVLVQHAILADAALHDAQARAAELEQRLDELQQGPAPASSAEPSFLGALFGRARPNETSGMTAGAAGPWTTPASRPPFSGAAVPATAGLGGYAPYPAGGGGPFSGGGGLGSFLRGAGTTAAGVAGGAFLFEGLSDMFGGGRRHEMFGGDDRAGFADTGGGDRAGFADTGGGGGDDFDVGGGPTSGDDYS